MNYYSGLPNFGAKAHFLLHKYGKAGRNIVFFSAREEDMEDFLEAAESFALAGPAAVAGKYEYIFLNKEKISFALALYKICTAQTPLITAVSYADAAMPLPYKKQFEKDIFTVERDMEIRRGDLLDILVNKGYERVEFTENQGEFAVRGSVVDVFCITENKPLRLYFAGNKIESISVFDIETQNTVAHVDEAAVVPLTFTELPQTLEDWFKQAAYVYDEPLSEEDLRAFPSSKETEKTVILGMPSALSENLGYMSNISFGANMELVKKEFDRLKEQGYAITVFCLNKGEQDRLSEMFHENHIRQNINFLIAPVNKGFYDPASKQAYITSSEILNRQYRSTSILKKFDLDGTKRTHFKDLVIGDYVVHMTHGIGRYRGLEVIDGDVETDCLILEFRRGSRLFVPVQDFGKVHKYVGLKGRAPTLSSLGGVTWRETKARVKENARENAEEILRYEAERAASAATAMFGDAVLEREFADSFPYEETPDQTGAINDILSDLERQKPMERVLIGDVGFGKTEVAIRAALRAALSGKQTVLLVPTTILAAQHYKTFSKRMAGYPVRIEMLSRFQTPAEQRAVIEKIKNGVADIIIGTHRVLSKDVKVPNLGLSIIDEEHRFGVRQKEKIKALRRGAHSLMLSATPIPRTLNQSLSSLRDLSVIETPPQGRMPIKTMVMPFSAEVAAEAVRGEIARGGQVYYVYNRVQSMESRRAFLQNLLPEAKICVAHGQMDEDDLEETLWDFFNKRYDILLASTIIESGLDVTNANTLIIEQAQDFGLAQLYQLRGRIGRGDKKAYCYLFHPDWLFTSKKPAPEADNTYAELLAFTTKKQEKDPSEEAKKRLSALTEFSELGSGFKLAMRDMEIRGAGDLLGIKQHGLASEVGVSMFLDLVAGEVKKLKGEKTEREMNASVNIHLPAYIPPDFLPDDNERLRYYKELMNADETKNAKILERLRDLGGPLPEEVKTLSAITLLGRKAGFLKIRHIEISKNFIEIYFTRQFKMPEGMLGALMGKYGQNIKFISSPRGDGLRINTSAPDALAYAAEAVAFLKNSL